MLTDEEWRLAYDHLLRRILELGNANSMVIELQQVTQMRYVDDLEPTQVQPRAKPKRRSTDVEAETDLFAMSVPDAHLSPEKLPSTTNIDKQELDVARNRAPTPREVFLASTDVLAARLREVPAVAVRLQELLDRPRDSLVWRSDASEDEFSSAQEAFSAYDFALDEDQRQEIEGALQLLEQLLREER
jgi:hypothetical protein